MQGLPTASKADLLTVWGRLGATEGLAECAAALGFHEQPQVKPTSVSSTANEASETNPQSSSQHSPAIIQFEFPVISENLLLWQAAQAETLEQPESVFLPGQPLTDEELRIRHRQPKLAVKPMIPWRRLLPFLRRHLGTLFAGSQIDTDRLIRQVAAARPVLQIPRLLRKSWAPRVAILVDGSREFDPFRCDADLLVRSLTREAGKSAVVVVTVSEFSRPPAVPVGIPVLACSCMGLYVENQKLTDWWAKWGVALHFKGHFLSALCPVPWPMMPLQLQRIWHPQVWDIGIVPGRKKRPVTTSVTQNDELDRVPAQDLLLNLLASAAIIEPALLRAVRRVSRRHHGEIDVQAEWRAWEHRDCWRSDQSFGIEDGEPRNWRLENRGIMYHDNPQLVNDVQSLIDQQHSAYSCAIELETALRSWNQRTKQQQQESRQLLQRIIDRLRQLALEPASPEGTRSGLPAWFNDMIQRLPPQIRSAEQLAPLIAEGLALTDTWLQAERELPAGVAEHVYREQLQAAEQRIETGQQLELDVGLQGTELVLQTAGRQQRPWWPLAQLRAVTSKHLTVSLVSDTGERQLLSRMLHPGAPERIALPADIHSLLLETPAARLQLHKVPRPAWASRFWQDASGTAAEFRIGDVPFVMRWIPPGRFLMGSPDDEQGRYSDEGLLHEVTISRGYWLGQTPVTQQQWQAVVQAAQRTASGSSQRSRRSAGSAAAAGGSQLKAGPSHFEGKPLHPVESVNWHQCVQYCQLVQGLLGGGLQFRLPSEAEWEYACRAGTSGAFNDDSSCTEPEGTDPALEKLGWYTKNSGGKTQPVGLKQSNGWGLYDMHGNVWEWCRDAPRQYSSEPQVDSVGSELSGASRVLRGGSWSGSARYCRAACRDAFVPGFGWDSTGLRLSAGPQ